MAESARPDVGRARRHRDAAVRACAVTLGIIVGTWLGVQWLAPLLPGVLR